jgi:hypothetical protein
MGRAPVSLAGVADIVSEQEGFAAKLGVLEIAAGIFTGPREVPHGFLCHLGDLDCREIAGAREASQLQSVSAVRFDPITSLVWNEGGGHHPAVVVFLPEIPIEPGATGTSLIDKDAVCGLRLHRPDELINVTLSCPNGAQKR